MLRPHKNSKGTQGILHHSMASHRGVVSTHVKHAGQRSRVFTKKHRKEIVPAFPQNKSDRTCTAEKFEFSFCPLIREIMIRNGISDNVAQYCSDHWTPLTIRCYEYKLRFWRNFAAAKGLDPFDITQEHILQMLIFMFEVQKKKVRTIRSTFTVGRLLCRAAGCPFSV